MGRKRPLTELDLLARRAAQLFYEKDLAYSAIETQLVAEGFDVRGERDVRFLLSRARDADRRLIALKAEPAGSAVPPIHDALSAALADEFDIPVVLVAKTGLLASESGARSDLPREKADLENDELHRLLGALTARHVLPVIRDGDLVGVGAGRGVAFTIDALRPLFERRTALRDVRVQSLVGAVNVYQTWGRFPENLEADNNASKLATIFELERPNVVPVGLLGVLDDSPADPTLSELRQYLECRPEFTVAQALESLDADSQLPLVDLIETLEERLAETDADQRQSLRDRVLAKYAPHLADEAGERMQVALFGFGVLGPRHHLLRFERLVSPAIRPELDALSALAEIHQELQHAVVDVCNHFSLIPAAGVPDDILAQAHVVVRRLNRKLLVVKPSVLDRAREKVLVGGGHAKWRALEGILAHPDIVGVRPTTVITDEGAARQILLSRGVPLVQ